MHISTLSWAQIEEIYLTAMQTDFPAAERKPLPLLRRLYDDGICTARAFMDGEQRLAYAILQRPDPAGAWLLDYLAVDAKTRGTGVGGAFLRELQTALTAEGATALLLEIERIDAAQTPAELDERTRRKHFYLKNGVIETAVFTRADGGIAYELLCLPLTCPLIGADAAAGIRRLYEIFFAPGEYEIWT